jgi:predicted Zn-dependent protease
LYRRIGERNRLAALIAEVESSIDDVRERARLCLERVRLRMQDGDAALVADDLIAIVDLDGTLVEAALLLAQVLEKTGRMDDLARLLANQLELAKERKDTASIVSLARRLGTLLEGKDTAGARDAYVAGLEWAPSDRALLRAVLALPEEEGDGGERAEVMENLLALETGEEAERLALTLAAARSEMWDEAAAERALEMGFRAHPTSEVLRTKLAAAYTEREAWEKLAELVVLEASGKADAKERAARLCEAARLYRTRLNNAAAAAGVLRKAREASPEDSTLLSVLVDTLAAAGDPTGALDEITRAVDACTNDEDAATLLAQRAKLRLDLAADDFAGALADSELAYARGGDAYLGELAALLQRAAEHAHDAEGAPAARPFELRLASVLPKTGDPAAARAILEGMLKENPQDRDALATLAWMDEEGERWEEAIETLKRLALVDTGTGLVATALRMADACEKLGRIGDAREALERARQEDPAHEALRARLERVYADMGAYHELAEMSLEDARAAADLPTKFANLVRAGAYFLQQGEPEEAITPLEEAKNLRPTDSECVLYLADAYTILERAADASELLTQAVQAHKGRRSRDLAALYHRLARIAQMNGDANGIVSNLATALDMDSQHGAVASELAVVAMHYGNLELAMRALRAITMMKATAPMSKAQAYLHLAEIAHHQGDKKKAVLMAKRAYDEDPSLEGARAMLDSLQHD